MLGILLLLSLVATPEALTLTGAVLLALVISVTLSSPMPHDVFVRSPEKQAEYERNSLKGVKFTADGKMVIDSSNPQSSTQNQTLPSDAK
jgi:hypothetical protein